MGKRQRDIKSRYKRSTGKIQQTKSMLIVCGGEETEPSYFQSFKAYQGDIIHVKSSNKNPIRIVEKAIDYKAKASYDKVWCVFDKDNFKDFSKAVKLADKNDISVAYSNKSFELWVLMHFDKAPKCDQSGLFKQTVSIFSKELKEKYSKNMNNLYSLLIGRQEIAIKRANCTLKDYKNHQPSLPVDSWTGCTTVHYLVEELNDNSPNRWNKKN